MSKVELYQTFRNYIPDMEWKTFKEEVELAKLVTPLKVGLIREYRAYYYLMTKYSKSKVRLATFEEDMSGIDIFVGDKKVAVSGFGDMNVREDIDIVIQFGNNGKLYQTNVKGVE